MSGVASAPGCMSVTVNKKTMYIKPGSDAGKVMSAQMEMAMGKDIKTIGFAVFILMSFVLTAMGKGSMVASIWSLILLLILGYGGYRVFMVDPKIVSDNTTSTCAQPAAPAAPTGASPTSA